MCECRCTRSGHSSAGGLQCAGVWARESVHAHPPPRSHTHAALAAPTHSLAVERCEAPEWGVLATSWSRSWRCERAPLERWHAAARCERRGCGHRARALPAPIPPPLVLRRHTPHPRAHPAHSRARVPQITTPRVPRNFRAHPSSTPHAVHGAPGGHRIHVCRLHQRAVGGAAPVGPPREPAPAARQPPAAAPGRRVGGGQGGGWGAQGGRPPLAVVGGRADRTPPPPLAHRRPRLIGVHESPAGRQRAWRAPGERGACNARFSLQRAGLPLLYLA